MLPVAGILVQTSAPKDTRNYFLWQRNYNRSQAVRLMRYTIRERQKNKEQGTGKKILVL